MERLTVAVLSAGDNFTQQAKIDRLLLSLAMIFALLRSSGGLVDNPVTIHVERSVVRVNTTLRLDCNLTTPSLATPSGATPNATALAWTQDGEPVAGANDRVTVVTAAAASQLVLRRVQFHDSGVYACGLDDGSPASNITIQVGLPPTQATDLECYSRNFRTVHCSWTNGPDTNLPTSHQLLWKKYSYYRQGTPCNGTICELEHMNKPVFFVVSSNSLADATSDSVMVNRDLVMLNPPRLTAVIAKSKSALLVKWRPPRDYDDYDATTQKQLEYQLQCEYRASNATWRPCYQTSPSVPFNAFSERNMTHPSHRFGSLPQPYGLYKVSMRVKAHFANVWSRPAEYWLSRTLEAAPESGATLDLMCIADNKTVSATERNVQLLWQPLPEYKMNGLVLYYVINVNGSQFNVTGNSSSYVTRGLDPYEHYSISIVGYNSVGSTDEDTCEVHPMPAAIVSPIPVVAGIIMATFVFIVGILLVVCAWQRVKNSMVHIPDIPVRNMDNLCTYEGPNRGPIREKESYDELIDTTLFVDLTPESDSCGPCVLTNGFVLEKDLSKEPILEPLESRRHPLLSARRTNSLANESYSQAPTEQEGLLNDDPFPPEPEAGKGEEAPGDYPHHYGGWKDSALSIRSGGSYMHLREEDAGSYTNMTDRGLSAISEDGPRVGTDRSGDARETQPNLPARDGAHRQDSEQPPQDVTESPYTIMGIGRAKRGSGNPSQNAGVTESDGLSFSHIDTNGKENRELRDQPRRSLPVGRLDPTGKTKPLCDAHPGRVGDEFLEAAKDVPCNALGNYVQQGLFLSPSANRPSSRSESPRPGPSDRAGPRPSESCCPSQATGATEDPAPGLPGRPQREAPSALDSPDSLQDDIPPYVLNACVLSGSAEPLLENSRSEAASPRPLCDEHPGEDSNCSSSTSLSDEDSSSETTPLMVENPSHGDSESSSRSDKESGACSEPAAGAAAAAGEGGYIAPDQLPRPGAAGSTPTAAAEAACCNGEADSGTGSYVSPGEVAKWAAPEAANTMCNGLRNEASHDTTTDYITGAQLPAMVNGSAKHPP